MQGSFGQIYIAEVCTRKEKSFGDEAEEDLCNAIGPNYKRRHSPVIQSRLKLKEMLQNPAALEVQLPPVGSPVIVKLLKESYNPISL